MAASEGFWCYDEVGYVYERGLMNGTGPATFTPNGEVSPPEGGGEILQLIAGVRRDGDRLSSAAASPVMENRPVRGEGPGERLRHGRIGHDARVSGL